MGHLKNILKWSQGCWTFENIRENSGLEFQSCSGKRDAWLHEKSLDLLFLLPSERARKVGVLIQIFSSKLLLYVGALVSCSCQKLT